MGEMGVWRIAPLICVSLALCRAKEYNQCNCSLYELAVDRIFHQQTTLRMAGDGMDSAPPTAKMNLPALGEQTALRPRLTEKITEGVHAGRRLTLVCAPEGSGKTTLAFQWLASSGLPAAYISLGEEPCDPALFFRRLFEALEKLGSPLIQAARDLFAGPFLPKAQSAAAAIAGGLAGACLPLCLLLDDWHAVKSPYLQEFLQCFADAKPACAHLVLLSREDPPFKLQKYRARGEITELRAVDLHFDAQEAQAFLAHVMNLGAGQEASLLLEKTGGWIAGLQMAALAMAGMDAEKAAAFAQSFGGDSRCIFDDLAALAVVRLGPALAAFVKSTSVLDKLSPGLCDFVTQADGSESMLHALWRANLFITPLRQGDAWYRYHPLFAKCIAAGLAKREKNALLLRAAQWLAQNGRLEEALSYMIRAGDWDRALELAVALAPAFFKEARLPAFLSILDALPESKVLGHPMAAAQKGWALLTLGDMIKLKAFMDALAPGFASSLDGRCKGLHLGLMAALYNHQENPKAEGLAAQALDLLDAKDEPGRITLINVLADAQKRGGKSKRPCKATVWPWKAQSRWALPSPRLYRFTAAQ